MSSRVCSGVRPMARPDSRWPRGSEAMPGAQRLADDRAVVEGRARATTAQNAPVENTQQDEQHHQQHGHAAEELEHDGRRDADPRARELRSEREHDAERRSRGRAARRPPQGVPEPVDADARQTSGSVKMSQRLGSKKPGSARPLAASRGCASVKMIHASPAAMSTPATIETITRAAGEPSGPARRRARWHSSQHRHFRSRGCAGEHAERDGDDQVEGATPRSIGIDGVAVAFASCAGRRSKSSTTKNPPATEVFLVRAMMTLMSGGIDHADGLRQDDAARPSGRSRGRCCAPPRPGRPARR